MSALGDADEIMRIREEELQQLREEYEEFQGTSYM